MAAMAQEVAAHGYRATKVTEVVKTASVSSRDFYDSFETKEECFLAVFDAVRSHVTSLITEAVAPEDEWPRQVVAALRAALDFFAANPDLARLALLESVSATPTIGIHFREAVRACAAALARGRDELDDPNTLLPEAENAIAGGIVSLATRRIVVGEVSELPALLPDMTEFVLAPYLGAERAAALAIQARASIKAIP